MRSAELSMWLAEHVFRPCSSIVSTTPSVQPFPSPRICAARQEDDTWVVDGRSDQPNFARTWALMARIWTAFRVRGPACGRETCSGGPAPILRIGPGGLNIDPAAKFGGGETDCLRYPSLARADSGDLHEAVPAFGRKRLGLTQHRWPTIARACARARKRRLVPACWRRVHPGQRSATTPTGVVGRDEIWSFNVAGRPWTPHRLGIQGPRRAARRRRGGAERHRRQRPLRGLDAGAPRGGAVAPRGVRGRQRGPRRLLWSLFQLSLSDEK